MGSNQSKREGKALDSGNSKYPEAGDRIESEAKTSMTKGCVQTCVPKRSLVSMCLPFAKERMVSGRN